MCDYGSGHLLKRVIAGNGNIAFLFVFQSMPGLLVTVIGLIPVMIAEKYTHPLHLLPAYFLYACSAAGMSLVVCSLSGKLSNLVLTAPVVTMAASLMSGLLYKLPDWAAFWEKTSVLFPGNWFVRAINYEHFLGGAFLLFALWFAAGILTARILGKIKSR